MSKLTTRQMEVVNHDGHLLVIAGPGSGKTTTTIAKARRILRDPARSLLMVTFTRDGAEEMRKRLRKSFDAQQTAMPGEDRLLVSTFHSIAIKHLRRCGIHRPLLPPGEQDMLLTEAMEVAGIPNKERGDIGKAFETVMYAEDPAAADVDSMTRKVVEIYESLLDKTGQVDLYTVMRDCALGAARGNLPPMPYTDMVVDEGQDTDDLQRQWIFAHARAGCRVTIVGDDDQSIYEWRNALGYKGMRDFLDSFEVRSVEMGENFRCRSEILTPAALLIAENKTRLGKDLVARRGPGGFITAFNAGSQQASLLAKLVLEVPDKHKDCAVLARVNRSLDEVELRLRQSAIPYKRIGSSIWDHPLVVAYLGILECLLTGRPAGLLAWLNMRKISPNTRHEIVDVGAGHLARFLEGEVPSLNTATAGDAGTLREIATALGYWRRQLRAGSVREVILDVAAAVAVNTRSEHQQKLLRLCSEVLAGMSGTLSSRLQTVSRRPKTDDSCVTLMTMHAAKGQEFETVHIIDVNKPDDASGLISPEAERRLMYVAITRAKNACVVWHSEAAHPHISEADLPTETRLPALVQAVAASG